MPVRKLIEFLDNHKIKYVTIDHSVAYTAQEAAASSHIPGRELAKTVMVKIDGKMTMAVLPASYKVDFDLLKKAAGASKVSLASEQEFGDIFPECEVGAMPPFGNLFGLPVLMDDALMSEEIVYFNCGSHTVSLRMKRADLAAATDAQIEDFHRTEASDQ